MILFWKLVCVIILVGCVIATNCQNAAHWNDLARESLNVILDAKPNTNPAKNVIFFLGDGMSIPTITAARIRDGQLKGVDGVSNSLSWESFPNVGLIKTYNTDYQVPDSAGTATAFFSGVKTKSGVVGLDDQAIRGDCASAEGADILSNLHMANKKGKATGVISTTRVTHATPSATYAHSPERNWESDVDIPDEEKDCTDITYQLVHENAFIKVILGGGRVKFMLNTQADPEYPTYTGEREDGNDLIDQWRTDKDGTATYVWNKNQFDDVDPEETDYLLGLFEWSYMRFESDRSNDPGGEPSLLEMTRKAIQILSKDEDGFFLAIESGLIDPAHHEGRAFDALGDTIAMNEAVKMAMDMTDSEDTLIVVTADHAHVMGIAGYPTRNNPILGLVDAGQALDGLPYTTLGYVNGPGGTKAQNSYQNEGIRRNYDGVDTEDRLFVQEAIVPTYSESHGGDDVAVFALGPMAHLFSGVQEQSYIAHAVRYAACLDDDYNNICNTPILGDGNSVPSVQETMHVIILTVSIAAGCILQA